MTAKIDWYREVLELEPNSKVFFPLGRLLAEEGNTQEAISVLEHGLERHPEYLEARLCLIEILYKNSMAEKCEAEIEKLNRIFTSYAGFWHAWAACLASDKAQADTASLLRFLAAHFVSGPLQLHEVLNRGLDAMLQDAQPAGAGKEKRPEPETAENAEPDAQAMRDFADHQQTMLDDLDAVLESDSVHALKSPAPGENADASQPMADMDLPVSEDAAGNLTQNLVSSDGSAALTEHEIDGQRQEAEMALSSTDMQEEESELPDSLPNAPESMPNPDAITAGAEPEAEPEPAEEQFAETSDGKPEEADCSASAQEDAQSALTVAGNEAVALADLPENDANMPPDLSDMPDASGKEIEDVEAAIPEAQPEDAELPVLEDAAPPDDIASHETGETGSIPDETIGNAAAEPEEILAAAIEPDMPMDEASLPQARPEEDLLPAVEEDIEGEPLGAIDEDKNNNSQTSEEIGDIQEAAVRAEAELMNDFDLPPMQEDEPILDAPVDNAPADKQKPSEDETEPLLDEYAEEEQFSLRTRSMAEVLAEQGDIKGALDIYQELAAAATSADELNDINQRVATLQSRLKMTAASAGFKADEEAQARSKEKLIGMLEALAQRVEARAQG